jgi:hypothetical protein
LLATHNAEEAITFPSYLPAVSAQLPTGLPAITDSQMLVALAIVTVIPLAVVSWANARPASRAALWSALLIQTVVLINVASHVAVAVFILHGYGPGLATALALNLPFSVYLLRRAWREQWVSRRAFAALVPGAIVVHGPLIVGLVLLAGANIRGG